MEVCRGHQTKIEAPYHLQRFYFKTSHPFISHSNHIRRFQILPCLPFLQLFLLGVTHHGLDLLLLNPMILD